LDNLGESKLSQVPFDQIADVYDDTRRALDSTTLDGIVRMIAKHGCSSILEIGVGTGRISVPLKKRGYEITGADISRRMMEKARAKGIENLILADGRGTPFRDKSFDASLMAHVFHLLPDPLSVMREAARVSNVGVFGLLRKGSEGEHPWIFPPGSEVNSEMVYDQSTLAYLEERRERFRSIAKKYNWNWDSMRRERNWRREQEVLEAHPPDDLLIVSDILVSESIEERISRFEKGAYSFMLEMPEEMRKAVINEMRISAQTMPERASQPRHYVYQLAMWTCDTLLRGKQ